MESGRENFWSKVKKTNYCWEWTAFRLPKSGYGQFHLPGTKSKTILAHRYAYKIEVGPIPKNLHICHKCDNTKCVRPSHLFAGTRSDNMKDCAAKGRSNFQKYSPNKKKVNCPKGHLYSGKNLIIDSHGWRKCKTCANESRMKVYYASR